MKLCTGPLACAILCRDLPDAALHVTLKAGSIRAKMISAKVRGGRAMSLKKVVLAAALLLSAAGSYAQPAQNIRAEAAVAPASPVTIESYYRIRWGSAAEFKRLYERNHTPLLREMQRIGFIRGVRVEEPFTHMAGAPRWDLRVTITYRDATAAVVAGGAFDQAFEAAKVRLFPDRATFDAEEARRFSLLEEHWDVIVTPVTQQ